jgi:hypothetical protein
MKKVLTAALLMTGALAAHADGSLFTPFHADYDLEREGIGSAHSVFTLEQGADGSYSYKSVMHATGIAAMFFSDVITETSTFTLEDGRPKAKTYSYSETGKHPSSQLVTFDWAQGYGITEEDGRSRKKKLEDGLCDVQLLQLRLAADVAADKLADSYRTLNDGEVAEYKAERLPGTKVRAGGNTYDTRVVALHDATKGRTITIWVSPALHYMPVQIKQEQTGKKAVTLTLEGISFGSAEAPSGK